MLSWNELILYPAGHKDDADIYVEPSVILPQGWQFGTALTKAGETGDNIHENTIHFNTVSLEQLIDSPLLTGRYFVEIPLAPEVTPKHFLDIAADGPEDLKLTPETINGYSNLVREDGGAVSVAALRELSLSGDGQRPGGAFWAGASPVERRSGAGADLHRRQLSAAVSGPAAA
jgi:hypothetical protein